MSLSQKINDWVKNGLLTAEQGEAVAAFERNRKSALSPLGALILLGVFAIGTGIVAIIASNWQAIPNSAKLLALFAAMAGAAHATDSLRDRRLIFEAMLFLDMLLYLGAIGLIGQIYHLHSAFYKPMLFWCFLALFPVLQTQKMFLTALWEVVLIASFMVSPWGESFARFLHDHFETPMTYSAAFLLLHGALTQIRRAPLFVVPLRKAALFFAVMPLFSFCYVDATGADSAAVFLMTASAAGACFAFNKTIRSVYAVCLLYACFVSVTSPFLLFLGQTGILIALLFSGVERKDFGFARIMALCAGIRVLSAYFFLFGSLLETGGGLILTGLFILGIAYGWHKVDGRLKAEKKQ